MYIQYFILFFAYSFTRITIPMLEKLFIDCVFLKQNYKGNFIPCSMGIIFISNTLVTALFLLGLEAKDNYLEILICTIGILTMGFIGLIDDFLGNNDVKGFKGHIKMLRHMELSTGGLKAVFGGVISVLISMIISRNTADFFVNILMISLFANFINLLDLRPGRALKSFLIIGVPVLFFISNIYKSILLSFIGTSLAYLPYDIKGHSMLGDIGSNSLGIILGIIATTFSINIKIILTLFLILANLYSEKYSISRFIQGNKLLRFLDDLGRG